MTFEKAKFLLKTCKKTKVTAEPQDIMQLKAELTAIIKYNLGCMMKVFNKTALLDYTRCHNMPNDCELEEMVTIN